MKTSPVSSMTHTYPTCLASAPGGAWVGVAYLSVVVEELWEWFEFDRFALEEHLTSGQ